MRNKKKQSKYRNSSKCWDLCSRKDATSGNYMNTYYCTLLPVKIKGLRSMPVIVALLLFEPIRNRVNCGAHLL